jgi:Esterase-like activity of phytase
LSARASTRGRDLKISALIPVDQTHLIVEERTDTEARFHTIALDPSDDLVAEADKTLLVNLAGVSGMPGKLEGAALKSRDTLVVISDNDFGFVPRAYAEGEHVDYSGIATRLVEVKLS